MGGKVISILTVSSEAIRLKNIIKNKIEKEIW